MQIINNAAVISASLGGMRCERKHEAKRSVCAGISIESKEGSLTSCDSAVAVEWRDRTRFERDTRSFSVPSVPTGIEGKSLAAPTRN